MSKPFLVCFMYAAFHSGIAFSSPIKAILFDIFGTTVEINNSLVQQGRSWSSAHHVPMNWPDLVQDWIQAHVQMVEAVRTGELPWMTVDEIHARTLSTLLKRYSPESTHFASADISEMNRFWHKLVPWSDVGQGLSKLHVQFKLGPLSNGNEELLRELAQYAHFPWDFILSSEGSMHYKPDPQVYEYASEALSLSPSQLLLVAAQRYDLRAAKKLGWKTAFVSRTEDTLTNREFDYVARDFIDLADQLVK